MSQYLKLASVAFAAGVALAASSAHAAHSFIDVELAGPSASSGIPGSFTFFGPGVSDIISVTGKVLGQGTAFEHTVLFDVFNFTPNQKAVVSGSAVSLGSIVGIDNLTYSVNGSAPVAAMADLGPLAIMGAGNTLTITGITSGTAGGDYKVDVALTPIPGAMLLLGPALAGLGYVGYRRRGQAAA